MAEALAGTGKPFVGVSGTLALALGGLRGTGTEENAARAVPQADGENAVISLAGRVAAATVKLYYRESVKNITVTVSDDVYREARIRAAEQDTSVSALVADYLRQLSAQAVEFTRLEARQELVRKRIKRFSAGDRLGREELHARAVR